MLQAILQKVNLSSRPHVVNSGKPRTTITLSLLSRQASVCHFRSSCWCSGQDDTLRSYHMTVNYSLLHGEQGNQFGYVAMDGKH
jgi:hypothetical protein